MQDPRVRAIAANALIADYQSAIDELSRLRRDALQELMASGVTQAEIADLLNISRSRVSQILSAPVRRPHGYAGD